MLSHVPPDLGDCRERSIYYDEVTESACIIREFDVSLSKELCPSTAGFSKTQRSTMRSTCLALLIATLGVATPLANAQQYVGIPRHKMEYVTSDQRNSQWCWAASIQMILNYYGVNIAQEQIVARTYGMDPFGRLPNWGGNFQNITANLNNWNIDNFGRPYAVSARLGLGAPTPAILLEELSRGRPVMVAYSTGPNSGHAVIVTAASFTMSPAGPVIQSLVVRDPWPSAENIQNRGRVEYPGWVLAQRMQHFWYIRVNGG